MPASIIVSGVALLNRANATIINDGIRAKTNAFPTKRSPPPMKPTPAMIARAAPNPAPAEIPKVKGDASGFLSIPCISAPAIASPAPARTPIITRLILIFHTTIGASSGTSKKFGMNLSRIVAYTSKTENLRGPSDTLIPHKSIVKKIKKEIKNIFLPINFLYSFFTSLLVIVSLLSTATILIYPLISFCFLAFASLYPSFFLTYFINIISIYKAFGFYRIFCTYIKIFYMFSTYNKEKGNKKYSFEPNSSYFLR